MNRGMDKTKGPNSHILVFFLAAFFILFSGLLFPEDLKENALQKPVEARLVAEVESIKPGTQFCVAVWLRMEEGWHTYWKNPGDSGLPTSIEWDLPEGFVAGDIQWPYPHRFETSGLISFGYEGQVLLLIHLKAPVALKSGMLVRLSAGVDWLACKEECVPGHADLSVELPVREQEPKTDGRWKEHFARTQKNLPKLLQQWKMSAALDEEKIVIQVLPSFPFHQRMTDIVFFPEQEELTEYSEPQNVRNFKRGYMVEVKRSKIAVKLPNRLKGVLYSPEGWDRMGEVSALRVDVPLHRF
jgi:DsbC/DsbD-like thiol-disulfide interchange protein